MKCAWQQLLSVLPKSVGQALGEEESEILQELRLRVGQPPELICKGGRGTLSNEVTQEDVNFVINAASRYSPWAAQTMAQGYLTAPGGHRIGVCGDAVVHSGEMSGIRRITSLNIRVARDFPCVAEKYSRYNGSILIIGPPGSGKTTLLRDLIRQLSYRETVAVVDERGELFPQNCFDRGRSVDVLYGCPKPLGIDQVLRTMGPDTIAVDEITAEQDCDALLAAGWCGVRLLATAHASSVDDLRCREIYKPLLKHHLFTHVLIMKRDKSHREERISI